MPDEDEERNSIEGSEADAAAEPGGTTGDQVRDDVARAIRRCFRRAFDDWRLLIGFGPTVARTHVRVFPHSATFVDRCAGHGVLARTRLDGKTSGPIAFAIPGSVLVPAVARATMSPVTEEARIDPRDERQRDAARALMSLFCGSATLALEAGGLHGANVSRSAEDLAVELDPTAALGLGVEGALMCIALEVELGESTARAWCFLPETLAGSLRREPAA